MEQSANNTDAAKAGSANMKTRFGAICDNLPLAGCLIILVAVPLFFHINSARSFEPDKVTLLRCMTCLVAVAWAIGVIEGWNHSRRTRFATTIRSLGDWASHPVVGLALLLFALSLLSTALSLSPRISAWGSYHRLQGTYTLLCYLVLFGTVSTCWRKPHYVQRLVTAAILASVPISLYGIVQKLGWDPFQWNHEPVKRVGSTFGNAVFLASYLIMVMPLTVCQMMRSLRLPTDRLKAPLNSLLPAGLFLAVVALQAFAVLFSQSRGPIVGLFIALFVMGLVGALLYRHRSADRGPLRGKEAVKALGFAGVAAILAVLGAGSGGLVAYGLQQLPLISSPPAVAVPLLAGGTGGLLAFGLMHGWLVCTGRGQRWLWLSWTATPALAVGLLLVLHVSFGPWNLQSRSIRKLPYVGRVAAAMDPQNDAVRIRRLIWDSALRLVGSERPLGIPQDAVSGEDTLHGIRPFVGYGPESQFNTLASVYPPQLKYVEDPTLLADRCHNESLDWLVTHGIAGLLAYYALIAALVSHCLAALGLSWRGTSHGACIVWLMLGAAGGSAVIWMAGGRDAFVALGAPGGLVAALIGHLVLQGAFAPQSDRHAGGDRHGRPALQNPADGRRAGPDAGGLKVSHRTRNERLLLVGLLGAFVGHFIEVQFSFSHTATYLYFWTFAGVLVALDRVSKKLDVACPDSNAIARTNGLVTAVVLGTLVFTFITPGAKLELVDQRSLIVLAMATGSLLIGCAVTLTAVRQAWKPSAARRRRVVELFAASAVAYPALYLVAHRYQLARAEGPATDVDPLRMANVAVVSLLLFFSYLSLSMVLLALSLPRPPGRQLPPFRKKWVWAHATLIAFASAFIWYKNMNVVRAEIYLKEGNAYADSKQWEQAISLHELARAACPRVDDYCLTLAQDYFLLGHEQRAEKQKCKQAWVKSARVAVAAHRLNPYNPDHTGNLGRLYANIGRHLDRRRYRDALQYFEKSVRLAPTKVQYHNLWAQTHRLLEDHEAAVARLRVSVSIDDQFPATWVLLGDTYADTGQFDKALRAHTKALTLRGPRKDGFAALADANLPQRFTAYGHAGRLDALTRAVHKYATTKERAEWDQAVARFRHDQH